MVTDYGQFTLAQKIQTGYRAVNSAFPPVALFDDVADEHEFEQLYSLQARTNPRLQNEIGRIELIPRTQIPFGIPGCSYATAPFTHVNPAGSRFSDGSYGVLYIADCIGTALAEVTYHQNLYWSKVEGLRYDRMVLRGLRCKFEEKGIVNTDLLPNKKQLLDPDSYQVARQTGKSIRTAGHPGIRYDSVRKPDGTCWGMFTPKAVRAIIQTSHYEMIWDGHQIASTHKISLAR